MRAFIHKVNPETGRDMLGTENGHVTNNYASLKTLKQYAFRNLKPGIYHVEAFNGSDIRYNKPDYDFIHQI